MSWEAELRQVRGQLDSLAHLRLNGALDQESEHTYRSLCDREQELLEGRGATLSVAGAVLGFACT